jgi:beta-N-acetylhexosaminidase
VSFSPSRSNDHETAVRAVIVSLAGAALTASEARMLAEGRPAGVILFARNCVDPEQLAALTQAIRTAAADPLLPVLIDQEGGRVMRLKPPAWRSLPPMAAIGALAGRDLEAGLSAARLAGQVIGADLAAVGINVDCAPVLDVAGVDTTPAIGDRSFGGQPELVGCLGSALMAGLEASGVAPVIKHLPGHGRARVDSHLELPVVDVPLGELRARDFVPFRHCRHARLAMTAHLLFPALDAKRPATQPATIIETIIRGEIGFAGILISDDLSMQALAGPLEERAVRAIEAGCDLALYCHGDIVVEPAALARQDAELHRLLEAVA